ncbi:Ig-like domain-containing protein, partial [Bacillus sp. SIMBA_005]
MVNTVRPSVVLSTTSSSYDNIKTITATFSEPVTGFTIADIDMSVVGTASAAAHSLTTADNITYT